MTKTTSPLEQTAVEDRELTGVDLARVALHQAREAAKKRGASEARTPRGRRPDAVVRHDRREPTGFAAVLQGLMTERAWTLPAAGGSVLDRWPDIATALSPQLVHHVTAVAFHSETGQLDLRPDSPAYATQLRLISTRIAATANQVTGTQAVRAIRVLATGATVTAPRTREAVPAASAIAAPEAPAESRQVTSEGFRQALAACLEARPERHVDPAIAAAVERQNRALRQQRERAFADDQSALPAGPAPDASLQTEHRRSAAASHTKALRRARAERVQQSGSTATIQRTRQAAVSD
ncbi:DciA family protein [Streptomyces sp. NPDC050315]|uniref:DciA family protein n=1 Tax=Streptomyces sp. NPDC050315 TaxID=3155039 RepID=UPI00344977E3